MTQQEKPGSNVGKRFGLKWERICRTHPDYEIYIDAFDVAKQDPNLPEGHQIGTFDLDQLVALYVSGHSPGTARQKLLSTLEIDRNTLARYQMNAPEYKHQLDSFSHAVKALKEKQKAAMNPTHPHDSVRTTYPETHLQDTSESRRAARIYDREDLAKAFLDWPGLPIYEEALTSLNKALAENGKNEVDHSELSNLIIAYMQHRCYFAIPKIKELLKRHNVTVFFRKDVDIPKQILLPYLAEVEKTIIRRVIMSGWDIRDLNKQIEERDLLLKISGLAGFQTDSVKIVMRRYDITKEEAECLLQKAAKVDAYFWEV